MSNYSSDNEVVGATALTGALIAVTVAVVLAFLASTLPQVGAAPQPTNTPAQSVVDTSQAVKAS